MKLEVTTRKPKTSKKTPPLVFVHGAYGGAWVWDLHFLPFFAEHGYEVHALSLRGHGSSAGWEGLAFTRMRDYVQDLEQVVADLSEPPILVGHSMGGAVVQHVLSSHKPAGAVLMASVPPHGLSTSFFHTARTTPQLMTDLMQIQLFGPAAVNAQSVRRALFSDETPESTIQHCLPQMRAESSMVIMDLLGLDLPPALPRTDVPVLVLGAENDAFVSDAAVQATARAYRTKAEICAGSAHAMMLDHCWEKVAGRVLAWLEETYPSEPAMANTTRHDS